MLFLQTPHEADREVLDQQTLLVSLSFPSPWQPNMNVFFLRLHHDSVRLGGSWLEARLTFSNLLRRGRGFMSLELVSTASWPSLLSLHMGRYFSNSQHSSPKPEIAEPAHSNVLTWITCDSNYFHTIIWIQEGEAGKTSRKASQPFGKGSST